MSSHVHRSFSPRVSLLATCKHASLHPSNEKIPLLARTMTEPEPPVHARTRPINAATSFVPYLTPHKIAILILIEFYCQGQCPAVSSTDLLLFLLECIEVYFGSTEALRTNNF